MTDDMKLIESCRICKNRTLTRYLDLGKTPLANAIIKKENLKEPEKTYPLEVMYCRECHLSQLSVVVDPKILFSNYPYRSSISETFINHCRELRDTCYASFNIKDTDLIVDIASNDGCLLQQFKERGCNVLGIDPAINLAKIANENGIETLNAFWGRDIAEKILSRKGSAKIITAMNVFAHVDNLNEFMASIKKILSKDGVFIIEAPHALRMIKNTEFDTIYHEHLSYLLLKPLEELFRINSMRIFRTDETAIHGGSIRVFACHEDSEYVQDESVDNIIDKERDANLYNIEGYRDFSKKVEKIKENLINVLNKAKNEHRTVAAYGASAKGNTLLNYCKINSEQIKFIADDTPEKQNHFAPGSHIPIVKSDQIITQQPDYLLLLAWNFATELIKKTADYKKIGGKYIIPIPEVKIIIGKETDNV